MVRAQLVHQQVVTERRTNPCMECFQLVSTTRESCREGLDAMAQLTRKPSACLERLQ